MVHIVVMSSRRFSAAVSGMARFRAQLVCGVCLNFLQEPKLLDCAHSFCQECLENVVKYQGIYRTAESPLEDNDVECPSCRHPTRLRGPGIDAVKALRTNFNLKELVEIVSEEEKAEMRDKGAKRSLKAVGHQASIERRQVERSQCKEHGKPLEFFCENCNNLSCSRCLKAHKRHDHHHVDDALPKHLDLLRGKVQPACEVAFHAEKKIEEMFKEKDLVSENRERTCGLVSAFFDKMLKVLEERKSAFISTVRKYTDIQLTKLDEQNQKLEEARTAILEDVGTIEKSLQHCEDPNILTMSKKLSDRLESLQGSILEITPLASESRQSSLFLQFQEDNSLLSPLSELGTLNVCSHGHRLNHNSIVGTVVVSNDDSNIYVVDGKETVQYVSRNRSQVSAIDSGYTYCDVPPPFPPKATQPTEPSPMLTESSGTSMRIQESQDRDSECSTPEAELISEESEGECAYEELSTESPSFTPNYPTTVNRTHSLSQDAPPIIQPVTVISNDQLCSPGSGEQVYPCGICCTGNYDNLIITDTHNNCLRFVDHMGEFLEKIGSEGKGDGQFMEPVAVAVSKDNFIFVAERENTRIQKFTSHGMYLLKFGQRALYGHQLSNPWGVAISPADGNVYVSDWDKSRLYIYKPNGKYVRPIGKEGFIKFKFPAGIAFDIDGRLLVADRGSHCVWLLTADGSQILKKVGSGLLHLPYGVATVFDGSIVVTESENNCIFIFSANGEFIRCFGRSGSEPGMFNHPRHICINRKGQLIVADEMNQRLQIFEISELCPTLVSDGSLYEEVCPL